VAVIAAAVVAAISLALIGVWWWPASFLALGLLFVLERQGNRGLDPEPLRKGILGEEAVAGALSELPPSYRVLHGVETGQGDVDHVVIGPTGVFALETKAWEGVFYRKVGQLYYNGKPADHVLRQARGAAGNVRQLMMQAGVDEWVDAVVVAAQASVASSPLRFRQCFVVSIDGLVPFITGRRRWLSASKIPSATASLIEPGEPTEGPEAGEASSPAP
jgi:hypothetical protein